MSIGPPNIRNVINQGVRRLRITSDGEFGRTPSSPAIQNNNRNQFQYSSHAVNLCVIETALDRASKSRKPLIISGRAPSYSYKRYHQTDNASVSKTQIEIKPMTQDMKSLVVNFLLAEFRLNEPLTVVMGASIADVKDGFADMVQACLDDGCSFVAMDSATGKVCATRLNAIVTGRKEKMTKAEVSELPYPVKMNYVIELLVQCEAALSQVPDARKLFKFDIISVAKSHQKQHIAQRLVDHTMKRAAALDPETGEKEFSHLMTIATSFKTQQLYEQKLGFRPYHTVVLREWTAFDGTKPFENIDEKTNPVVKLLVKVNQ